MANIQPRVFRVCSVNYFYKKGYISLKNKNILLFFFILVFISGCRTNRSIVLPPITETPEFGIPVQDTKTPVETIQMTATSTPTVFLGENPAPMIQYNPIVTFTICQSGCDFHSIREAIEAEQVTNGSQLNLLEAVYTENDIQITKNLILQGSGDTYAIIQGAESLAESDKRIFRIEKNAQVIFRNLIIQHGHPIEEPYSGGGIFNYGNLQIEN
jgi:hypothetical protein